MFDVIDKMKSDIDGKELARLRDRIELKRRKDAHNNEALLDGWWRGRCTALRVDDLPVETVTREEMLAAARKYMPSHRQAYVRLALKGQ